MNRRKHYADQVKARETARKQKARYRVRNGAGSGYRLWSDEEDRKVLAHDVPDSVLAARIGRSVGAIQTRRNRLSA